MNEPGQRARFQRGVSGGSLDGVGEGVDVVAGPRGPGFESWVGRIVVTRVATRARYLVPGCFIVHVVRIGVVQIGESVAAVVHSCVSSSSRVHLENVLAVRAPLPPSSHGLPQPPRVVRQVEDAQRHALEG